MTAGILEEAIAGRAYPYTHRYAVTLETTGPLYGGMSVAKDAYESMPWNVRQEQLREAAKKLTAETVEMEESAVAMTVFRRRPGDGALCLSANQLRTMLQETAAALYQGKLGYFSLRGGLRRNLVFQPTLLGLERRIPDPPATLVDMIGKARLYDWEPITEPDAIGYFPRPIRKPPFERSIEANPECVQPPVQISFDIYVLQLGTGRTLTEPVLRALFEHAGTFVGLGAHRGLDGLGVFHVASWELVETQDAGLPLLAK